MRIFLTGCSSSLANAVLPMLCASSEVTQVVGIDRRPCHFEDKKFSASQMDIHSPELPAAMAGADAVVHLAFGVMRGEMSETEQTHNNVAGTLKVFDDAARCGIRKVVNLSSVSVYGAGSGLDESAPLRPAVHFNYARHKAEIERAAAGRHPHIIHLRSHLIFGRQCRAFLKAMVNARFFIAPPAPYPTLQIVHEDDVARAVMLALTRDVRGPFNLAAPEVTSIPELVKSRRRHALPLPLSWVRAAVSLARRWGNRDEFTWLDVFDTTLTVRCDKAHRELGWRPLYSAWEAVQDMSSKRSG